MSSKQRNTNHDAIASIYDLQDTERHDMALDCIDKLILQYIPEGAHIFDLGCGTGQIAQGLLKRGYQITGLDSSQGMLDVARKNAPSAEFILDDARFFKLPPTFHAAISTDAVLNYILSMDELKDALHNVYEALLDNGIFGCEMFVEELCQSSWNETDSGGVVKDENVWVDIWSYDLESKVGKKNTTRFEFVNGMWQRSDRTFLLKLYSLADVQTALEKVGFTEVSIYDVKRDLGLKQTLGERVCFLSRKKLSESSSRST